MRKVCVVCGKKTKIKLNMNGTYSGGHYFGRMNIPVGIGKWKKVGTTNILKPIKNRTDVVKWIGKEKEVEYWECNKCFNEAD